MSEHGQRSLPGHDSADALAQSVAGADGVLGTQVYTYDADKLVSCVSCGAETTVYSYDASGRPLDSSPDDAAADNAE